MTIHIDMNTLFIIQLITLCSAIGLGITTIHLVKKVKRLTDQISENNRLLYFNLKSSRHSEQMVDDVLDRIEMIDTNVSTLSTNLQIKIKNDNEEKQRKIYPTPELAKLIAETIREQIDMEFSLSKNLSAPSGEYVDNITYTVMQTYPKVHPDYITRKCIAIIENELSRFRSSE